MTAAAANREAKAREIENLLTMNAQHHDLWGGALQKPELRRVFEADVDVLKSPATVAETEFLNLVLVHYQTGWTVAKSGSLITLSELKSDLCNFLSLPLPRTVWEKTKGLRNAKFVRFVEKALESI